MASSSEIRSLVEKFAADLMAEFRSSVHQKILDSLGAGIFEDEAQKTSRKPSKTKAPKKASKGPDGRFQPKAKAKAKKASFGVGTVSSLSAVTKGPDGRFQVNIGGRIYRAARERDLNRYLKPR